METTNWDNYAPRPFLCPVLPLTVCCNICSDWQSPEPVHRAIPGWNPHQGWSSSTATVAWKQCDRNTCFTIRPDFFRLMPRGKQMRQPIFFPQSCSILQKLCLYGVGGPTWVRLLILGAAESKAICEKTRLLAGTNPPPFLLPNGWPRDLDTDKRPQNPGFGPAQQVEISLHVYRKYHVQNTFQLTAR